MNQGKIPLKERKNALEGVRVIDFSWIVAGPQCTRILADFGADVIKIENESNMDYARHIIPGSGNSPNLSGMFNTLNRNKRSRIDCLDEIPERLGVLPIVELAHDSRSVGHASQHAREDFDH